LQSFRSLVGAPDLARFNSVFFGGLLGSMFSFLQFLSSPIFGALSDIYGRKQILLLCVIGTLFSYFLWSQAATFGLFVLSRIVGGLCKASVSISTAIVTDVLKEKNRGKGMALIGVSFSMGFIFGPLIGAYFATQARATSYFYVTPAYFSIILTLIELVWILLFLPETLQVEKREKQLHQVLHQASSYVNPKALFQFKALKIVDENKNTLKLSFLRRVGVVYFLYLLIYSGLEFTLSFFTHLRFGYDSMQQGRMYFFSGLLMVLMQGGYVRRIAAEKQKSAAQLGLIIIIPSFLLIAFAHNKWMLFAGLALYAIASALVVTCLTTVVSSFGADSEKGTILGVFRALGALARGAGPFMAAAVFWLLGPTIAYAGGALLLLAPYILLRQLKTESV